jgi:hypothetical protein
MMDRTPPYLPPDWEPPEPREAEGSALTIGVIASVAIGVASIVALFL